MYRRYNPGGALGELVHCFWYSEGAPQTHARERLLPNGEISIVFNLRDDALRIYDGFDFERFESFGSAVLSGPRSGCIAIDANQQERVVGIQFRAGGAFPFLGMPAWQMEGSSVALEDVWRRTAGTLREQMLEASSVAQLFARLEAGLLRQMTSETQRHAAVIYAVQRFQGCGLACQVSDVIDETGLSARRFIELFRREVGLTPKVFSRVRRFQNVLTAAHGKGEMDWARMASECGYYDQAHFIHEFQMFSGLTPCAYLAAKTEHLNHVPVL